MARVGSAGRSTWFVVQMHARPRGDPFGTSIAGLQMSARVVRGGIEDRRGMVLAETEGFEPSIRLYKRITV